MWRLRLVACRKLAALALGPRVNLLLSFVSGLIIIYFFSWTFSLMIDKQEFDLEHDRNVKRQQPWLVL